MDGQTYNEISTNLIDRISKLELSETIETQKSSYPTNYWIFKRVPDLRVSNQNALTIENDNIWEGEKGMKDIRVFIKNNGIYFELGAYYKTPEELMIFKAFLSTFKFTDSVNSQNINYSGVGESCGVLAGPGGNAQCEPGLTCQHKNPIDLYDIGVCIKQ